MIRVDPQPEPEAFEKKVGKPGAKALLDGKNPLPNYWTECLRDLHKAYRGICAYSCFFIPLVTGNRSTEHFAPKSADKARAYEWANYRLVCGLMNSCKREFEDVLDPFEIDDDWFEIEFVFFQVRPAAHLDAALRKEIELTIDRLKLSGEECCTARRTAYDDWAKYKHCDAYMERYSPFLYREAVRQRVKPC